MTITRNFNLHLNAGASIPLLINANQYDSGEEWVFTLYSDRGVKYTPASGAIIGLKSDGHAIANNATVNGSGQIVVTETEQMTASVGKNIYELSIDSGTHGTANFIVLVEPQPYDSSKVSDSDISLIQEAIEAASNIKPYGTPLVAEEVADMTDHDKVYVYVGDETGYTEGDWYYWDGSAWTSGGVYNSVAVQTDTTLAVSGMAADAKATGDAIDDLRNQISTLSGVPTNVRQAISTLFNSALYKDTGLTDEKAIVQSWAATVTAITLNQSTISISGEGTYQLIATTTPSGANVSWTSSDSSVATVSSSGLVTSVSNGACTITATSGDFSATCTVTVSGFATLSSISAVYTQSGNVYTTDSLDSLKSDLVVTAIYSDTTTATISSDSYTLSGTLTAGTSTITVSYQDKTTTFTVTVSDLTIYFYKGGNTAVSNGKITITGYTNTRAMIYLTSQVNGAVQYTFSSMQGHEYPEVAYPLAIPSGATKITVSCSGLCCAINAHKDLNGTATQINSGYWSEAGGETNYDLSSYIASGATHVSIGFKNTSNSSLADTTIDSTTVSISFS